MAFFEVKNLVKYFGGLAAVNDISFQVDKGEIFGLIGPNGSGKTTIFNLISNRYPVTRGSIHLEDRNITGMKTHDICRLGIGRTFQMAKSLSRMSVLDNIMAAAFTKDGDKAPAKSLSLELLDFCGLAHREKKMAKSLPGGERKRLEIARAMATNPKLLLLDETSSGLTTFELDDAMRLILEIRNRGITIIIVEHIMKVIMTLSDRIHAIHFGRSIAEGFPQEVAKNPAVINAYFGKENAQG